MPSENNFNPYKFSLFSSLYISIGTYFVINYNDLTISLKSVLVSFIIFFFSFLIIQLRVRKLFFERVIHIYKDLEFESDSLIQTSVIDSDMNSFAKDLEEFVKLKRSEIESLKKEDLYRKEFVGNVAHKLKTPLFAIEGYISNLLDGAMDDKELLKKSRYSIPFFMHPVSDMKLNVLESCICEEYPKSFNDITAGDFLNERLVELGLLKK